MGAQVEVLNSEGQASGSVELPDDLFGIEVSEYAPVSYTHLTLPTIYSE